MRRCWLHIGVLTLALLAGAVAWGHDPRFVSLRIVESEASTVLEMYVPTAAIVSAFAQVHGDDVALDSRVGQERIVAYVRERMELVSPGGSWSIGAGGIRVDDHETVVRLMLSPAPGVRLPLRVEAPLFSENAGTRVTLRYVSPTGEVRVLLTEADGYATIVTIDSWLGRARVVDDGLDEGSGAR